MRVYKACCDQFIIRIDGFAAVTAQLSRNFTLSDSNDFVFFYSNISVFDNLDFALCLAAMGRIAAGGGEHTDIINQQGRFHGRSSFFQITGGVSP